MLYALKQNLSPNNYYCPGAKHYTGIKVTLQTPDMPDIDSNKKSSQNESRYCVVLCTCPDLTSAESIANMLVKNKLAACVNIVPGLTSIYQWKGNLEKSQELLLIIKSKSAVFSTVENVIRKHHPYELPEIISIPLKSGFSNYLSWIDDNIDENAVPAS